MSTFFLRGWNLGNRIKNQQLTKMYPTKQYLYKGLSVSFAILSLGVFSMSCHCVVALCLLPPVCAQPTTLTWPCRTQRLRPASLIDSKHNPPRPIVLSGIHCRPFQALEVIRHHLGRLRIPPLARFRSSFRVPTQLHTYQRHHHTGNIKGTTTPLIK